MAYKQHVTLCCCERTFLCLLLCRCSSVKFTFENCWFFFSHFLKNALKKFVWLLTLCLLAKKKKKRETPGRLKCYQKPDRSNPPLSLRESLRWNGVKPENPNLTKSTVAIQSGRNERMLQLRRYALLAFHKGVRPNPAPYSENTSLDHGFQPQAHPVCQWTPLTEVGKWHLFLPLFLIWFFFCWCTEQKVLSLVQPFVTSQMRT